MNYRQVTENERYIISHLWTQGKSVLQIARETGRHRSTIAREIKRNRDSTGRYHPYIADELAVYRRSKSRRNSHFRRSDWNLVLRKLDQDWSPEQISLKLAESGKLRIHWETIYRYIWADKAKGGLLYHSLRQSPKLKRKRYRGRDSRGILPGKRHISQRPKEASERTELGHFEIDLVHGYRGRSCIMTLVDRKSRLTIIAKLRNKMVKEVNSHLIPLVKEYRIKTITSDNGCEFHGYKEVEEATSAKFYFATPHHSWERGTSENTNGLIRQYLPKWMSMRYVNQSFCDFITRRLNQRPRKILDLKTPRETHYAKAA